MQKIAFASFEKLLLECRRCQSQVIFKLGAEVRVCPVCGCELFFNSLSKEPLLKTLKIILDKIQNDSNADLFFIDKEAQ